MSIRTRRRIAEMDLVQISQGETHKTSPDSSSGPTSKEEDRVRMLAALLFANLGGTATIQQAGPGQIAVAMPDGPIFTIKMDKDRTTLGGSPNSPNLDQFIGGFDEEDGELRSLNSIAENAVTLINEAMESEDPPAPVFFKGLADKPQQDEEGASEAPVDDQSSLVPAPGSEPSPDDLMGGPPGAGGPDMGGAPGGMPDMGMGGAPGGAPPDMGMGAPGGMPPGPGMPPAPGGPPMGAPQPPMQPQMPMMPAASRRRISSSLEELATELEKKGFKKLAARVDRITNTFERRTSRG